MELVNYDIYREEFLEEFTKEAISRPRPIKNWLKRRKFRKTVKGPKKAARGKARSE